MTSEALETIRDSVIAPDVARALGLRPDRHGRCACPIHNGKDRNMKLYPNGYKCFVCGASGDVIRLVQEVLGMPFKQAVAWLNSAFHLGLCVDRPLNKKARMAAENARKRKQMERANREALYRAEFDLYIAACKLVNLLEADAQQYKPKTWQEPLDNRFVYAMKMLPEAREVAGRLAMEVMERGRGY